MANGGAVNFFNDGVDDVLLPDGIPSFDGGQFSNVRANLLQENQSALLTNCDVDKLGKLKTRRGTIAIGSAPPSGVSGHVVQGLTSFQTKDYNYIVAAQNAKLYQWNEGAGVWTQIARGGVADNEDIVICRQGQINNAGGYPIGTTILTVDHVGYVGLTASGGGTAPAVGCDTLFAGEKLYFQNNLRTNYYEYTIKDVNVGTATAITLEEPGLVFPVGQDWIFTVARPAKVNNATGYAPGATSIAIAGYNGTPGVGEKFVIKSENTTHTLTAGTTNTLLNFTVGLQAAWVAANATTPVVFAQGNDALYFSDGIGDIYGWSGNTTGAPNFYGGTFRIGAHSILDNLAGSFVQASTQPPTAVKSLLWYQNRLIASAIVDEPDAIYFSDFFDASSWDRNYQKMRVGGGESDPITGCLAWTDLNMIVFKKNSCYLINLDPAQNPDPFNSTLLVASFAIRQLHKLIGCPAPFSAVQVGGGSTTPGSDVFFVDGDKRVHSIRRVIAAETQQEVGSAVSLPVQDILDTINIDHIDLACAMYHNGHYILAIPSTRGNDGGLLPNSVMVYNLLTQSWVGSWNWPATAFSRRSDLGAYSKLIYGNTNGRVVQWLDDQSLDDETTESYQDFGAEISTIILTRAITFGDYYSNKTGLSVELEFDESTAATVTVKVILDKVVQHAVLAVAFDTLTQRRLRLGVPSDTTLPFRLPGSAGLMRKAFDLQRYGTWRELQFQISSPAGKLGLRSIRVTGWIDTIRLQTIPVDGIPVLGIPPTAGGP